MANQMPRAVADLLALWDEYCKDMLAADIFKKWGGLFLISAALSRRCWAVTNPVYPPLFPNLYAMLAGYPGSGKDTIINKVVEILTMANEGLPQGGGVQFSGRSLSPKGIIDMLGSEDCEFSFQATVKRKKVTQKFHSFLLCAPELTTVMPVYNTLLIAFLNELYNCNPTFDEQIRGRGTSSFISIPNPHVAAFMGIQPATLFEVFPEQAFRMGFFARVNLIYTRERFVARPYSHTHEDKSHLFPKLVSDVRSIMNMSGQFKSTKAFGKAIDNFSEDNPRALKAARFEDYNTRRWFHLHKIAMLCSASESSDMVLDVRHFERAQQYLFDAEVDMPRVFEGITTSDGFEHTVEQVLTTAKKDIITHQQLERALRKTHKPYEVGQIIRSMVGAGDLEEIKVKTGLPRYRISGDKKLAIH